MFAGSWLVVDIFIMFPNVFVGCSCVSIDLSLFAEFGVVSQLVNCVCWFIVTEIMQMSGRV